MCLQNKLFGLQIPSTVFILQKTSTIRALIVCIIWLGGNTVSWPYLSFPILFCVYNTSFIEFSYNLLVSELVDMLQFRSRCHWVGNFNILFSFRESNNNIAYFFRIIASCKIPSQGYTHAPWSKLFSYHNKKQQLVIIQQLWFFVILLHCAK